MIDELAAVIGMKSANLKRELLQHGDQRRQQPGFANLGHAGDHLPLRDLIHGVDVIHAFDPVAVALMHRYPGRPCGSGQRLSPIDTGVGLVLVKCARRVR